jgi:hypothetical protein
MSDLQVSADGSAVLQLEAQSQALDGLPVEAIILSWDMLVTHPGGSFTPATASRRLLGAALPGPRTSQQPLPVLLQVLLAVRACKAVPISS